MPCGAFVAGILQHTTCPDHGLSKWYSYMLEYLISSGFKGALLGGGLGLIGISAAHLFVRLIDNPADQMVKTNFVVNSVFGFGMVFFAALSVLPYAFDTMINKTTQHTFAFLFFAIAITSGVCLFDAMKRKIEWLDDGFRIQRWNDNTHFYTWKSVDNIEWNPLLHIWCIHLNDGETFSFHPLMTGAIRFLDIAKMKANLFTENRYSHLEH